MRALRSTLCGLLSLCLCSCAQPKDLAGADERSWRRGETHVVDGCTVTLTNGWLAESDGWTGSLFFDVVNEGDSTTPCMAVGALVAASTNPVSITSESNLLKPGQQRTWKLDFKSPAIADIYANGAWLYVGVRGRDPTSETGFHVYELPREFEFDYE